jgi:hypothetical protein
LKFEDAINAIQERLKNHWSPAFDYIGHGYYYEQVKTYLDTFPHVRVFLFEDLKEDSLGLINDLFNFLELDNSFIPDISKTYNPSGTIRFKALHKHLMRPDIISARFPFIKVLVPLDWRTGIIKKIRRANIDFGKKEVQSDETKKYLKTLYKEDILKLQELICRDLSEWWQ